MHALLHALKLGVSHGKLQAPPLHVGLVPGGAPVHSELLQHWVVGVQTLERATHSRVPDGQPHRLVVALQTSSPLQPEAVSQQASSRF
jgi:hypothetical protein